MKIVQMKSNEQIANEWDDLADLRFDQMTSGIDRSFNEIIKPQMLQLIEKSSHSCLDVGCGTGILTNELSEYFDKIVGIDLSQKSIDIANKVFSKHNTEFVCDSIENYSSNKKFSTIIANMVLMDIININAAIRSIVDLLENNGDFILSITHPCFWPKYYGYDNNDWFDYNHEFIIESSFKISLDKMNTKISTHVHRPLSKYINILVENGLQLCGVFEPVSSIKHEEVYCYPRFLFIKCKKIDLK